jgi:hypothetical protein
MRNIALVLFFAISFIITISNSEAYTMDYAMVDDGTLNHYAYLPSFYWGGQCSLNFSLYATATHSMTYNLFNTWYSPDAVQLLYGNPEYSSNITCMKQGDTNSDTSLNDFYEAKTRTTTSATTTKTWVKGTYTCQPRADNWIIMNDTLKTDSFGNYPYAYGYRVTYSCSSPFVNNLINEHHFLIDKIAKGFSTNCGTTFNKTNCEIGLCSERYGNSISCVAFSFIASMDYWTLFPFNSGEAGLVNISILDAYFIKSTGTSGCSGSTDYHQIFIYDTATNSTINKGTALPYAESLTLNANRLYWLFIGTQSRMTKTDISTCSITYNSTIYNVSVYAYEPDWSCTDWSVCEQNIQFRTCTDLNGIIGDKAEYRDCGIPLPVFSALLGFEQYNEQTVYICGKTFWGVPICADNLQTQSNKFPKNWTISGSKETDSGIYRQNYITMTPDAGAKEGSLSLKMWYYPPKIEDPVIPAGGGENDTVCGNQTQGQFPYVSTGYNKTLFIYSNISFPSQYMDLRWYVRKCSTPVRQYVYGVRGLPYDCYYKYYNTENNYSLEPEGRYGLRLTDANTGAKIVDYYEVLTTSEWQERVLDLSSKGIIVNHNYTISLAVNPENELDSSHHCLYFDNFRATQRLAPFECASRCDGFDYLQVVTTDPCTFARIPMYKDCIPTNVSEERESFEPFCIGTTRYIYNKILGEYENFPNNDICEQEIEDAKKKTDQEANLTGINPLIKSILNASGISESTVLDTGFGFILSTIFLVLIINIIIGAYLGYKMKHWEAMAISIIGLMLIECIPPFSIFPMWFAIIFGVFLALFLAEFIERRYKGG